MKHQSQSIPVNPSQLQSIRDYPVRQLCANLGINRYSPGSESVERLNGAHEESRESSKNPGKETEPLREGGESSLRASRYKHIEHWSAKSTTQHVVVRLKDSLPTDVLADWHEELRSVDSANVNDERVRRIQMALDAGHGGCWLKDPAIAVTVENALLHFDGARYRLHAWVIMPNHVHILVSIGNEYSLSSIVHSWKSFTSHQANRILGRSGPFWQEDYFDRRIRNSRHFQATVRYIEENPVKAGLVPSPELWPYGSASSRLAAPASRTVAPASRRGGSSPSKEGGPPWSPGVPPGVHSSPSQRVTPTTVPTTTNHGVTNSARPTAAGTAALHNDPHEGVSNEIETAAGTAAKPTKRGPHE